MGRHYLFLLLLLGLVFAAKAQDTTAPVLHNIYVSPDTIHAGDTIVIYVDITDDISGPNFPGLAGYNGSVLPCDAVVENGTAGNAINSSGQTWNFLSGNIYYAKLPTFPSTARGTWVVKQFQAVDRAGNQSIYNDSVDFNAPFVILPPLNGASVDTSPPTVYSVVFDKHTVNSDSIVTATIQAFDTSGISYIYVNIANSNYPINLAQKISDSIAGHTYYQQYLIPHWADGGIWTVQRVDVQDSVNNYVGLVPGTFASDSFTVIASNPDTISPVFTSVQFVPNRVHRGDSLSIIITVFDSLSGINLSASNIFIVAPNRQQTNVFANYVDNGNGTITGKLKMTEYAQNGPWHLSLNMYDYANNIVYYDSDTQLYVVPDSGTLVLGNVLQSNGAPLVNSKVYMVKEDPIDSLLYVMRVATTDTFGNYSFQSERRDSLVYIKAVPDTSLASELPTYLDSSVLFTGARLLHFDTSVVHTIDTFHTLAGANTGGFGFIIGYVSQGAGKVDAVGDPEMQLGLVLVDSAGKFVTGTVTDSTGHFKFTHLANGTYRVYTDLPKINNGIAPTLTIDSAHQGLTNLQFALHDRWLELLRTGIDEINTPTVNVQPNPSHNKFVISFNNWVGNNSMLEVVNVLGETVYSINREGNQAATQETIDLSNQPSGIYLVRILSDGKLSTAKLIKD